MDHLRPDLRPAPPMSAVAVAALDEPLPEVLREKITIDVIHDGAHLPPEVAERVGTTLMTGTAGARRLGACPHRGAYSRAPR